MCTEDPLHVKVDTLDAIVPYYSYIRKLHAHERYGPQSVRHDRAPSAVKVGNTTSATSVLGYQS